MITDSLSISVLVTNVLSGWYLQTPVIGQIETILG